MGIFDERGYYKPFEYPYYFDEGYYKQVQAHWTPTEIQMQPDVKDWNENLKPHEKHLVENILLGFAQTETFVGDYWSQMVARWFPKHEIVAMALQFGAQEQIHAWAYSYLNDTLGLDDFQSFLNVPEITEKFDLLMGIQDDYTPQLLKQSQEAREDVARSLAIFSAFAEGVSLYSSFAVLYSFQLRNMLKGIGQQMVYSVKDEDLHSRMGCALFRHMCHEFPGLKESAKKKVKEAALLMVELEHKFIDKMFEKGDLENLRKEDLKNFIVKRAQEKYEELGYDDVLLEYDKDSASELNWFYHLTGGVKHTDFFAMRPTDYAKIGNEDWENIWNDE